MSDAYDWRDDARKGYDLAIAMLRWRLAIVKALKERARQLDPFEGLPRKHFKVVLADPPWNFQIWAPQGNAFEHYECMSLDAICDLPVAEAVQDDAVLFLWVVQPMLPEAMRVLDAWGFVFKTVAFAWVKMPESWGGPQLTFAPRIEPRLGLGYHTRSGMEQCWLAVRGNGYKRQHQGVAQVVHAAVREHSRKPDEVMSRIEMLVGDVPRIELFARTRRPGWEVWGDQTERFGK